jgi:hypothetical protein
VWVDRVRVGYDAASYAYRDDEVEGGLYESWIDQLRALLRFPSRVVDLGCGCGIPVARELVPGAQFTRGDLAEVEFPSVSSTPP